MGYVLLVTFILDLLVMNVLLVNTHSKMIIVAVLALLAPFLLLALVLVLLVLLINTVVLEVLSARVRLGKKKKKKTKTNKKQKKKIAHAKMEYVTKQLDCVLLVTLDLLVQIVTLAKQYFFFSFLFSVFLF